MLCSCHSASRPTRATSANPKASPCSCSSRSPCCRGWDPASISAFCSACSRISAKANTLPGSCLAAGGQCRLELLPLLKGARQGIDLHRRVGAQGHQGGIARHVFMQQGQHMGHQCGRELAVVQAQHQRQPLGRHVGVFFVEGRHHLGQQQDAPHGRNFRPRQAARITAAIHALVVLEHGNLHRSGINAGILDASASR